MLDFYGNDGDDEYEGGDEEEDEDEEESEDDEDGEDERDDHEEESELELPPLPSKRKRPAEPSMGPTSAPKKRVAFDLQSLRRALAYGRNTHHQIQVARSPHSFPRSGDSCVASELVDSSITCLACTTAFPLSHV